MESGGKRKDKGSEKDSISPGGNVALQPELSGSEEKGGEVSTKGKEAATHKHMVRRDSHFLSPIEEYKQMDTTSRSVSLQDLTTLNTTMESGGKRKDKGSEKDSISPGGNVALQPELSGSEESRGQVSEEQKEAATCVHTEAETPGLKKKKVSPPSSQMHKQVDVKPCRNRLQGMTAVRSLQSGEKRNRLFRGWNAALPIELQGCEADVTLDPATAHPLLVLSEDRKSMRYGDTCQDLPNNPERFNVSVSALGSEGFTSGRHYWEVEVEVGPGKYWAIGVARDSVRRKGMISLAPHFGFWILASHKVSWVLEKGPRKIGVYLDYASGEVRFYNAENMDLFISLTATFTGRVIPFFHFWSIGSHFKLSPCQR
ncbi:tripartite motif-containing protein 15-like isoform X2 [Mauremys mutica]|uniref:tripartite motif-containing protein 15-like isoform X2 n=1 Tax=Mauremys mutica TaxID=74926 RepID=UPI001D15F372|nr:tripartite motif-containing protein 15-like isoform X2 [Mauremys mutica]